MKKTLAILTMFLLASQILFGGSISGTVSGSPANDILVEAFDPGNPQSNYVALVENGAYTITDVDFSTYIVKLSGMGLHVFYDGVLRIEDATPVDVTEINPDITGIDFDLNAIPQGMIMGMIFGEYGVPIFVDGTVLLFDEIPNDPNILPIDEYILDGAFYIFEGLELGTYFVALEVPDETTLYYDMVEDPNLATPIVLDANNFYADNIDFTLEGSGLGTAEISGIVTDDNGEPVADALVELVNEEFNPWFQFFAVTAEDGSYSILEIPAGEYYMAVSSQNYFPYWYDGVSNIEDATLIEVNDDDVINIDPILQTLVLHPVTGTVLNDDGEPIEGCQISAFPDGGPGGPGGHMWLDLTAYSLADGTFELSIPEGDYVFEALLFNWMFPQVQYFDHKDTLEEADLVTISGPLDGIDFDLDVIVYNSVVSGNITDENNLPIEDAYALLYPVDASVWFWGEAISDENGLYELNSIPPGDYYLSVYAQEYLPYFYDGVTNWEDATIITIVEDDVITIDPVLSPMIMHTVSGTVLDDQGNPMADVWIFAQSTNWMPGMRDVQTDENGNYEMNVAEGEYIFGAETFDFINWQIQFYDHKTSPDEADVVIVDDDVSGIDFDFAAPVTYDNSISGTITLEGVPVENAMIVCVSVDETFGTADFTNELGQYELENLPENDYYIFAYGEEATLTFYPGVINFEDAVAVTALGFVTGIDFELEPIRGSGYLGLNGFVHDDQNQPVANVSVSISDMDGNIVAMAQTNNDGFYETNTVISGDVSVLAAKVFFNTSTTTTTMNGNATIDFTIEPMLPTGTDDTPNIDNVLSASNYPNPFNPSTNISFNIPIEGKVNVMVYNLKGQKVKDLVSEQLEAGQHQVVWNGLDNNKKAVSSGIYFYKVKSAGMSVTKKMILMK